jgi:alkanesulfonate monooxygenase SsuD/methylene tetrahydromethanopterin reductase-like flavin-dependent oxidoreductase (luciferase family)
MTRPRQFRFGVFGESVRSRAALLETARRAEDSGYATFLIRDHFVEEPFGDQLAPLTALATVAGATQALRVGSLVLSNDYRHPVMLAKEIATLDVLSNGRVELGLGAGFSKVEYDRAGMSFDPRASGSTASRNPSTFSRDFSAPALSRSRASTTR